MSGPFVGELRLFALPFAPIGWADCDGQVLEIASNETLFSVIGATYGGDGRATFALPDLRGRVPIGPESGEAALGLGDHGGAERVALTLAETPSHRHGLRAIDAVPDGVSPVDASFASLAHGYAPTPTQPVAIDGVIAEAGEGAAHETMQPFLTLRLCIATDGLFPTRA